MSWCLEIDVPNFAVIRVSSGRDYDIAAALDACFLKSMLLFYAKPSFEHQDFIPNITLIFKQNFQCPWCVCLRLRGLR